MIYVLRMLKLVKSKEVPWKAFVQSRVSVIFTALQRHEDKKKNTPFFYLKITAKKLQDRYSLVYNDLYGNLIANLFFIPRLNRYNIVP